MDFIENERIENERIENERLDKEKSVIRHQVQPRMYALKDHRNARSSTLYYVDYIFIVKNCSLSGTSPGFCGVAFQNV